MRSRKRYNRINDKPPRPVRREKEKEMKNYKIRYSNNSTRFPIEYEVENRLPTIDELQAPGTEPAGYEPDFIPGVFTVTFDGECRTLEAPACAGFYEEGIDMDEYYAPVLEELENLLNEAGGAE